ncbi:MAG: hypothetical protein D6730_19560 [Bacteroidetes bacterium]|nr:MAG: hypothetical protein D6730_19560 [Bacteroidota bacterium]
MRYAYLGVAVLPPFLLAMCAYLRKQRIYWKLAAQTALLLYPLLGGLMAFQAWQQGKANYLAEVSKGFFPEHLLAMDAFPLKTFFYYGFIHQQALLKEYPLVGKLFVAAACLFSLILIMVIIYYAVIWSRPAYRQHAAGAWLLASCVVIGANVLMLAYLSLRVPPEQWGDLAFWTYVMESRYYAPAMLMILLSCYLLAFYGEMKHAEISGLRRGMRYFIYGTLLIAGAYFMLLRY